MGSDTIVVQRQAAQLCHALGAVRDDVDGADAAASGQRRGHLTQAILSGIECDDFDIGRQLGQQAGGVLHTAVYE